MIFTFSGLDGAGKSTQINHLRSWLFAQGYKTTVLWARGGYTPSFELLKRILRFLLIKKLPQPGRSTLRERHLSSPFVANLWLSIAIFDLMIYWGIYLRFKLLAGNVVICDRYIDDTRLDFKRNFPDVSFENYFLWRFLEWSVPAPDVSFLLWVPVDVSLQRSIEKNEPFPDDEETLQWRLTSYMDEKLFPSDCYIRIDCQQDIDTISSQVKSHIMAASQKSSL